MHPGGVLAIVNPASSSGRTLRRVPALQRALASRIPEIQIRSTEGPGHATLLARRALEAGARLVVSVGGDGTNSEVLAGFVDGQGRNRFPDAELGLLHAGTGGDFLRHLGRRSADQAIDALAAGAATSVDYGVATYVDDDGRTAVRPFLNVASAGVSGLVDYHVRRSNRWLGPTATYLLGSVRGIVEFRAKPVAIAIDGGAPVELSMALGVVANGQYFGGGMWVAPRGRCDDGVFEILHTPGGSRAGLLSLLEPLELGRAELEPELGGRASDRRAPAGGARLRPPSGARPRDRPCAGGRGPAARGPRRGGRCRRPRRRARRCAGRSRRPRRHDRHGGGGRRGSGG